MTRYVISDTHFGHENVIEYSDRPYETISEMEAGITENWNETVESGDVVFHVGDMCFKSKTTHKFWNDRLNGSLVLIKGNHDNLDPEEVGFPVVEDAVVRAEHGIRFHLVHRRGLGEGDWVIHGHSHNFHPFFDRENNAINVSADVVGFTPVRIEDIVDIIWNQSGETIESYE